MENRYAGARNAAERDPDFVDLIDTNFHRCGFRYPTSAIRVSVDRYFAEGNDRQYNPDPAGDPELRAAITTYYRDAGVIANRDAVVVTASASESYSHIFSARCKPGDRVLLPRPGYPLFEDIAARSGLVVDFYEQQQDAGWAINPDQLESQIRPATAAVVLISPNNPTGSVVSDSTIVAVGKLCEHHALFLVVDEVFSEILFGGSPSGPPRAQTPRAGIPSADLPRRAELPRPARLLPDVEVYTINGVSKLFASPDLKASWILVSGPHDAKSQAVEDLLIQNDLYLSASSLSQYIVADMFSAGMEFTRTMGAEIARRREIMLGEVDRIGGLSAIPPAGGVHLPVTISADVLPAGHDDEDVAVDLLRDFRVAVHPGYLYGFDEPTTVVMSYLAPEARIRSGLARFASYLSTRSR